MKFREPRLKSTMMIKNIIYTKKAKLTQKEPRKSIAQQLAEVNPHTKIPDSEIRLENIIPGSPLFVPYK